MVLVSEKCGTGYRFHGTIFNSVIHTNGKKVSLSTFDFIRFRYTQLQLILRVCTEIKSQVFVSRRMPDKARKHRNIEIFLASATMSGVMHSPPKCEVIFAWALSQFGFPDHVNNVSILFRYSPVRVISNTELPIFKLRAAIAP